MTKTHLCRLVVILMGFIFIGTGCNLFNSYEYKGTRLDPPLPIPDFELRDTSGQPFQLSDLEGNIALVYFGYTYCPDVCPLTMWDVKEALAGLEQPEQVRVVFISVDPERDKPEVLAQYLKAFGPEYIGLTDDFEKVQAVMKPFGAFAEREAVAGSAADYLVSHTARLFLVSPERELVLMYPFEFEPEDLRNDLAHLLETG